MAQGFVVYWKEIVRVKKFLVVLTLCIVGCEPQGTNLVGLDYSKRIAETMNCVWSDRHKVCVCSIVRGHGLAIAIAPDKVCFRPGLEPEANTVD